MSRFTPPNDLDRRRGQNRRFSTGTLAAILMLAPWTPRTLAAENPATGPCSVEIHLPDDPSLAKVPVRICRWDAETAQPV